MAQPDLEFTASIESISVSVKEKLGVVRRSCEIKLAREFDSIIADALGPGARRVRNDVASRDIKKVVIPIDALVVNGSLKTLGKDEVEIPLMRGITATAKGGDEEDAPPSVTMTFEFDFSEAVWLFLGRNVSGYAQVSLSRLQQGFSFPEVTGSERKTHA